MMKKLIPLVAMLALAGPLWASAANTKVEERLQNAAEVLQEVMNAPDKGIPLEIVEHAKCIAVIPHQIKAGFVVAAKFGKGVATCRTEGRWRAKFWVMHEPGVSSPVCRSMERSCIPIRKPQKSCSASCFCPEKS